MFNFENMSDENLVTLWVSLRYSHVLSENPFRSRGVLLDEAEFLCMQEKIQFEMWCELKDEIKKRRIITTKFIYQR